MFMDYYMTYYGSMILLIPAMIFAFVAQSKVKSAYQKYLKVQSRRGMTGAEVADKLLRQNGLYGVKVEPTKGVMTDHYHPKQKVVRLSQGVYDGTSLAALSIAAHECGHAIQHEEAYSFLAFREFMFPVVNFSNRLAMPLAMAGLFLSYMGGGDIGFMLLNIGIVLFTAVVLFQLITLPVELNASKRALVLLEQSRYLDETEIPGAKKMLRAAALTYVAAAAIAIASLLRLILLSRSRRR